MKLWLFSDLHLDVNGRHPFALPDPRPDHDVLVIAGDIMGGMAESVRWIAAQGLNAVPVVYVAGNHEFYGYDRLRGLAEGIAEAARHRNIHVLEFGRLTIGSILFIGATLWTDYRAFGSVESDMALAAHSLNDHRLIRFGSGLSMPHDAAAEHERARAFITHSQGRPGDRTAVVVTHHAPS